MTDMECGGRATALCFAPRKRRRGRRTPYKTVLAALLSLALAVTAAATPRTWTGAVSSNWSEGANWTPVGTPVNGDALTFGCNAQPFPPTNNDLPAGTTLSGLTLLCSVSLNGNPITLTGSVFTQAFIPHINLPVTVGGPLEITTGTPDLRFRNTFDVNGQTVRFGALGFEGPVNGTGTLEGGAGFSAAGTFSGSFLGSAYMRGGSLPNASFQGGVTGYGTVGPVTVPAGWRLVPGQSSSPLPVGTLRTGPLSLSGGTFAVGVNGDGTSSQLITTGSVSLAGPLSLELGTGAPLPGHAYTIIDNDGADPVAGTFTGLPEGSAVTAGVTTFIVSYHGGDGNDVTLTVASGTKAWTGAVNGLWSNPLNWSPPIVPAAGDSLLFPSNPTTWAMTNDLPPAVYGAMEYRCFCTIGGNLIELGGDLSTIYELTFDAPLRLATDIKLRNPVNLWWTTINGRLDMNGHTLELQWTAVNGPVDGTGLLTGQHMLFRGGGTFTGTITGASQIDGVFPNANVTGPYAVAGTIAELDLIEWGLTYLGNYRPGVAALQTKSVRLDQGSLALDVSASGTSDRITASGIVTLGAALQLNLIGVPAIGQTYTIIDNDGGDPVIGTFSGLPERATFTIGGRTLRISYRGGDGNDVTLRVIDPAAGPVATTVTTRSLRNPAPAGESVPLEVRVDAGAEVPTGTVSVIEDGDVLVEQALAGGRATVLVPGLATGEHHLLVSYAGSDDFLPASDAFIQVVRPPVLSVAGTSIYEGKGGTARARLLVRLSAPSPDPVTVAWTTQDGRALAGEDYEQASGTLTFAPGQTVQRAEITILGDTVPEEDEAFRVVLSDAVNATVEDAPAQVTIVNDDITYSAATYEYADAGGRPLEMDVYTPIGGSGPFSLIVWVAGRFSYDPNEDISSILRETVRGFIVAVPRYRSAAEAPFPAQAADLHAALHWLDSNAARLRADGTVILWGRGAGGHLAALVGMTDRVALVVDWSGASDLAALQEDADAASCYASFDAASPVGQLLGCDPQLCDEAARAASPLAHVTHDTSPFLIMHGGSDCTTPPAQSRRLHEALLAAHVESTLKILDGVSAFSPYWTSPEAYDTVDALIDALLNASAPPPPTPARQ
jgi:acetyl esterase/lipase